MKLWIIDSKIVVAINKKVCDEGGNPFHCFSVDKIESALHSTFYPGEYPFAHGGLGELAGALAFYICQAHAFQDGNKRTASLSALVFMKANGFDLQYPNTDDRDDFSDLIIGIAKGEVDINKAKSWFDNHKIPSAD